jgi:zinc protease
MTLSPEDNKATLGAYAICAPQNLAKVEVGFKEELVRMLKDGFTDEEIASAKSGLLQGKKVSRAQDSELARTLRRNLMVDRTMQWNKAYEQRLAALIADDVKRLMNKYLKLGNFSIIKAGDMTKVEG